MLATFWLSELLSRWLSGWMQPDEIWMLYGYAFLMKLIGSAFAKWISQEFRDWPFRIGVLAFLVLAVWFIHLNQGFHSGIHLLMAGSMGCFVGALSGFLLPLASLFRWGWRQVVLEPRQRYQLRQKEIKAAKVRTQRQQELEEQRARDAAEQERTRPERERLEKIKAIQEQQSRAKAESDRRRRQAARYECRLLYDRHSSEIKESLSRKRFDDYLVTWLSDVQTVEVVEERAEALRKTILDFFEPMVGSVQMSVEEINAHFETLIVEIESRTVDQETKESMLSEVYYAQEKALRRGSIE